MNQLRYNCVAPEVDGRVMAYCATTVPAANKWLDPDDWASVISTLSVHPEIDEVYLQDFGLGMDYKSFAALHGSMGYNTGVVTNESITNGLSLRLFIPY